MTDKYKLTCGCECFTSAKIMHFYFLICCDFHLKHLKDISHNAQNRRSGELSSHLFETYKNAVRPHGCNIYNSASDMAMAKTCPCTSQHHGIPHWKFILLFCEKYPGIIITHQEKNKYATNTCPTIRFHVYCNVSRCNIHGIHPYVE